MIAVRLPEGLEKKLNSVAKNTQRTKTDIVKEALQLYFEARAKEDEKTPYELGESLFGRFGSGEGDLSVTYKQRLKEKLNAKQGSDRQRSADRTV